MTTTERNDLLRYAFMRCFGAVGGYDLNDLSAYKDYVTLSLHHEKPWHCHKYATVQFTFEELCSTDIPELNVICQERFDAEVLRLEQEERQKRAAERQRVEAAAGKAAQAAGKLSKEQRDRAELARLKALYET